MRMTVFPEAREVDHVVQVISSALRVRRCKELGEILPAFAAFYD
jgi:hypothetical protein